jgi:hypothetical protein
MTTSDVTPSISRNPVTRRIALGAALLPAFAALGGCTSPLPLNGQPPQRADPAAAMRLRRSADAHGYGAYRELRDINIAYDGQWRPLIGKIQPEIVDASYRVSSQERLMPSLGINAQLYQGPGGTKKVLWKRVSGGEPGMGDIAVWRNGNPATDAPTLDASALVAEAYKLFLLGPLWLAGRDVSPRMAGTERVDGRLCDIVELWLAPGLGRTPRDRVALCIDREDDITRRMRFTLEGFAGTQGAVAEVDTFEHARHFGVLWPMRSFERVLHPIALPAHDWRIVGLDVNRGYGAQALQGPLLEGAAAAPAAKLTAVA